MDFKTCTEKIEEMRLRMVDVDKKIPILNNIALCLQKQDHFDRSLDMLEQVIAIDSDNYKALCRKVQILSRQGHTDKAFLLIKDLKSKFSATTMKIEDAELVNNTIREVEKELFD